MRLSDILSKYINLSPADSKEIDQTQDAPNLFTRGNTNTLITGNVYVSATQGVTLFNPNTGKRSIYLDPDGDAFFGKNIDDPADSSFIIFSNEQEYNLEDFGEGDVLFGDNSTAAANILWDRSESKFTLRAGETPYIDLDDDGLSIFIVSGAYGAIGSLKFESQDGTNANKGELYVYESATDVIGGLTVNGRNAIGGATPESKESSLQIMTTADPTIASQLRIVAESGSDQASIQLDADSDGTTAITFSGSGVDYFSFETSDLHAQGDLRVGGGLYVGSILTDPGADDIIADGDIYAGSGLYVGATSGSPGAGDLYTTNDARITGGLYVGSVATDPGAGDFYTTNDARIGGGLYVGSLATDPAADDIIADGDIYAASGLYVGATSGSPATGDLYATNDGRFGGGLYAGATNVNPTSGDVVGTNDAKFGGGGYFGNDAANPAAGEVTATVRIWVNDNANTDGTLGITVNQGANDDDLITLKSVDVNHGMTTDRETDTFGSIRKAQAANGGIEVGGYGADTIGMRLVAAGVTDSTGKATTSAAYALLVAKKKTGTTAGAVGSNANLLAVRNDSTTRFILDGDGDSHQDVGTAWTNFDDYNDPGLLTALSLEVSREDDPIRRQLGDFLEYNREALEKARLVTFNEDGHHFVNMSRLSMLMVGAIRQLSARQAETDLLIHDLRNQLQQLPPRSSMG